MHYIIFEYGVLQFAEIREGALITPYGIYDLVKQNKTWEEARDHCQQNGVHLVAFENQGEFDAVKDFIDVDRMYIGLND